MRFQAAQSFSGCLKIIFLTANALNFRAHATEFFLNVFVAAVKVVNLFNNGFAIGNQTCHNQAGGRA